MSSNLNIDIDNDFIANLNIKEEIEQIIVRTKNNEYIIDKSDMKRKSKPVTISYDEIEDICKEFLSELEQNTNKEENKSKLTSEDLEEIYDDDSFWD